MSSIIFIITTKHLYSFKCFIMYFLDLDLDFLVVPYRCVFYFLRFSFNSHVSHSSINFLVIIENGLKQGDALSPLLFNFALEYAIRKVQETNLGLDINGTHQVLAYADDVNLIGDDIRTIERMQMCY